MNTDESGFAVGGESRPAVAIVGIGLIGGSLALAFRRSGLVGKIFGVSRSETVAEALSQGVIDEGGTYDDLPKIVSQADVVFLCTPIKRILELLPVTSAAARKGTVITDVGSTKAEIVSCAEKLLPEGVVFIGGHPMAGSERSGLAAADQFLFQNAMYILTATDRTPQSAVDALATLLTPLGARIRQLDPETHDRVAAAVSHLPQLLALCLVEMVGKLDEKEPSHLHMAAGGFRDMTRIASSPYRMWKDILDTNTEAVQGVLELFEEQLSAVRRDLNDGMEQHFTAANTIRGRIPKDTKGFISPMQDVLVGCEDVPGVLAKMTAVLAESDLDVRDIELLKIREGEGGTFRFGFADHEKAVAAVDILIREGFSARCL